VAGSITLKALAAYRVLAAVTARESGTLCQGQAPPVLSGGGRLVGKLERPSHCSVGYLKSSSVVHTRDLIFTSLPLHDPALLKQDLL
jgi:hypothetical protein